MVVVHDCPSRAYGRILEDPPANWNQAVDLIHLESDQLQRDQAIRDEAIEVIHQDMFDMLDGTNMQIYRGRDYDRLITQLAHYDHGNPTTCLLALINCLRERNRGYEFQNFVLSYLDHVRTALPRTHSDLIADPILDKMQQFLVEHGTVSSTTIPGITLAYDESETMITRILRDIVGFHADIGNYISTQLREMEPEAVVIRLIKEYQNAQYRRVHHMQQRERT